MFRLIRAIIALIVLIALAYVAVFVPLGDKTLWQHLRAIAQTNESKQLVEGVKKKATEVLRDQLQTDGSTPSSEQPQDETTDQEKQRLRRLLREKLEASDKT